MIAWRADEVGAKECRPHTLPRRIQAFQVHNRNKTTRKVKLSGGPCVHFDAAAAWGRGKALAPLDSAVSEATIASAR
jgi:hypothetical protein